MGAVDRLGAAAFEHQLEECSTNPSQLPPGISSDITAPTAGCSEKARQQAVVWLAQDVYAGLMGEEQTLQSQLAWVTVWRDIVGSLEDEEGVARIHDLLIGALGQEGPMMLF